MPPLKVRKPAAILFDMMSSATKSYFIDQILFPYIRANAKVYFENNWENSVLQHDVELLRKAAQQEKAPTQIPDSSAGAEAIQLALVSYIDDALDRVKDSEAMTQFKFHIIFDGYANNRLETPVYTDVAIAIHHWVVDDGIKLFVFSNGWKEATRRYLQKTNHGDMNLLITGHFDTEMGSLTEAETYRKVAQKLGVAKEDVLFLTHNGAEGRAAKKAGLSVVIVATHRRDLAKFTEAEKRELPFIRSFNDLIFTGNAPKACELDGSTLQSSSASSGSSKNPFTESAKAAKSSGKLSKSSKKSGSSSKSAKSSSASAASSALNAGTGLSEAFSRPAVAPSSSQSISGSKSKSKSKSKSQKTSALSSSATAKSGSKIKSSSRTTTTNSSLTSSGTTATTLGSSSKKVGSSSCQSASAAAPASSSNSKTSSNAKSSSTTVSGGGSKKPASSSCESSAKNSSSATKTGSSSSSTSTAASSSGAGGRTKLSSINSNATKLSSSKNGSKSSSKQ